MLSETLCIGRIVNRDIAFSPLLVGVLSETIVAARVHYHCPRPFSPLLVGVLSETILSSSAFVWAATIFQSPTGRGAQ